MASAAALQDFHPACAGWFRQCFGEPTDAQAQAWPAIRRGEHTLIAAPTGSGKTLAAFFAAIDRLVHESRDGALPAETRILYISPLKALSNDIHRNLEQPLNGIADELLQQGCPPADIRVAVRTGDTPAPERQKMLNQPPHILVTTPESLYLLLTSVKGRRLLATVRSVIVDEIHAMLGDKRGSHLALSLQRLQALTGAPLQRIGLSATQKPIELVARYLTGSDTPCTIVDAGHRRRLDLRVEVPASPLSALMSNEVWDELYQRLVQLVESHHTTLVFVNTRRLSERLALALSERLGEGLVSSHHGSMSKEHRHTAEQRLKAGDLKVLVATASMELGIDIGAVDLVVQFASPKSIATFLQRVGRSGHSVRGTPKGILFPLTRDDLLECTALLDSIRRGELDRILMPEQPLDILAQQIVAEAAARENEIADDMDDPGLSADTLFDLYRAAWPYRDLTRENFDALLQMLADGYSTRLGRRGAWLHLDRINRRISPRRGARLTALTNGGAIPDMFDYQVVLDPEDTVVGTLNEDFALETLPGDIFTLGSHSWQLLRVDGLKVRVRDAHGMKPTIPFWFGEGPGRTAELSESVSRLRETMDHYLTEESAEQAVLFLTADTGLPAAAAQQLVDYLQVGRNALQVMPTQKQLVMERFFDEVGDMHVVIHSPFGSRLNRAWGLALRKRFCRTFNFELQAAANEDSIVISLGSVHSFVLEEVFTYLHSNSVREVLIQALLDAPMFEVRWRWNATRSLAIQRNRAKGRVPPQFQRMDAEDLVAQVFPDQLACQENLTGKRDVPDHPLVQQTVHDCLTEAMDIDGLLALLQRMEAGELQLIALDLREPSPFAQEIINARPYAFLDDAPFEERRTNAIRNRSWLDPAEAGDYSLLEPSAIERVREEAWPLIRSAEELHDALHTLGLMTADELQSENADSFIRQLIAQGRATGVQVTVGQITDGRCFISAERLPCVRAALPQAVIETDLVLPDELANEQWSATEALKTLLRGRLEGLGPVTAADLASTLSLPEADFMPALMALESEGFVFRGQFCRQTPAEQWCERRLLQRIHRYTIDSHREAIKPVSLQAYALFLFDRHEIRSRSLTPRPVPLPSATEGQALLQRTLDRLDGLSAPASAWEADIFPARMSLYDPDWLDLYCISGRVVWGRYSPVTALGAVRKGKSHGAGPVKATPVTLAQRANSRLWQQLASTPTTGEPRERLPLSSVAEKAHQDLQQHGASFFGDIAQRTGLLPAQLEQGLAELVAGGYLSSDSFTGLRALLTPASRRGGGRRRRRASWDVEEAGRWSLLPEVSDVPGTDDENLEALVMIYLKRWGVVCRSVLARETVAPPWRLLLTILKRMELRGTVRGGRFIAGIAGEQFALPDAVTALRDAARRTTEDTSDAYDNAVYHCLSAADPVNLLPVFLPQVRLPRVSRNRVLYCNGVPVAVQEGAEFRLLRDIPAHCHWPLQQLLQRREYAPQLRAYLGNL